MRSVNASPIHLALYQCIVCSKPDYSDEPRMAVVTLVCTVSHHCKLYEIWSVGQLLCLLQSTGLPCSASRRFQFSLFLGPNICSEHAVALSMLVKRNDVLILGTRSISKNL